MDKHHVRSWVPLLVSCVLVIVLNQAFAAPLADFTVTVSKVGNGQVTKQPEKPVYAYGDSISLSAVPDSGWEFTGWSGGINQQDWWNTKYDYRVPITVGTAAYDRFDKPVEIDLNFTAMLNGLGVTIPFAPDSLRLHEVDGSGGIVATNVPFQFDPSPAFNASNNATGTLIFLMLNATAKNTERRYMLYFDVQNDTYTPAVVAPRVTLSNAVDKVDQNTELDSLKIVTTPATYFYDKNGGGFSSVDDPVGKDWINYSSAPESAGNFRGIPNMVFTAGGGYFHPGRQVATTTVVNQGPLRATFRSKITGQEWQTLWSIYPTYATMTVEKAADSYWFLYEGTPGGKLDLGSDFVMRSSNTSTLASESWESDLVGEEWAFFADPVEGRALFMAQDVSDAAVDSYRYQNDDPGNEDAAMTVFGFGRKLTTTNSYLTGTSRKLIFGLLVGTGFGPNQTAILSAVKPLAVSLGTAEMLQRAQIVPDNPYVFHVTGNHQITATFAPQGHELTVNWIGEGSVTKSPDKPVYQSGEEVTLKALPAAGWSFGGWNENLGNNPEITIIMNGDRALTATFVQDSYILDVQIFGQGTVEVSPAQTTYRFGDDVDLTAVPDSDWKFIGWGGDLSGSQPQAGLTMTGNKSVVATFARDEIRNYLPMVSAGKK